MDAVRSVPQRPHYYVGVNYLLLNWSSRGDYGAHGTLSKVYTNSVPGGQHALAFYTKRGIPLRK